MNYVTTFIDLCKGVRCFGRLAGRPLWMAVWHFLLTIVICTVVVTVGRQPGIRTLVNAGRMMVSEEFGALSVTPQGGLSISNQPDESRVLELPGKIKIGYLTEKLPETMPELLSDAVGGIIFSGTHIAVWAGAEGGFFYLLPADVNQFTATKLPLNMDTVKQVFELPVTGEIAEENSSANLILQLLTSNDYSMPILFLSMFTFVELLLQTVMPLLLFVLVFGWFGQQRTAKLVKLKETLVIGLYASLPVLAVASLFPALKLPYLDFQLVFVLGTIPYTFMAVNYVAVNRLTTRKIAEKLDGGNHDE